MNDNTKSVMVTAQVMREKTETLYAAQGKIAQSMKQVAYTAGVMDATNFVQAIEEAARHDAFEEKKIEPPPHRLDMHTIAYILERMKDQTQQSLARVLFLDVDFLSPEDNDDKPPPGTRFS